MKTVLFDTRAWCLNIQPQMHEYFLSNPDLNIKPISVYHNNLDYKKYANNKNVENLADYYLEGTKKYNKSDLMALEKKYNLVNLWNVVYFDRYLNNKDEEYIVNQISYYIFSWENILGKYKPNYIVTENVTGAWNYLLWSIGKYNNAIFLGFMSTKNTNKYFFARDIYGVFSEMEKKFNGLLEKQLLDSEVLIADEFYQKFKEKHIVAPYMKTAMVYPKIYNFFNFYRIVINLYKDSIVFKNVKNDYKIDYRVSGYKRDFVRLFRLVYVNLFKIFELPSQDEKFVLFPLHYQPEASTDICAAYYSDQYTIIKHLARSLPFGYKLYVKEHSAVLGSKEIGFYKKIKKLANVKLIDPWASVSKLIKDTSAIAVLTGTSGLEGIIMKKPVIVFGHVFFDSYPQIYRVESIENLPAILNSAISNHQIDEIIYEKYIYSYITSGYNGRIHGSNFTNEEIVQHCENLKIEMSIN